METYGPKDKEALSLLRNTQAQLEDTKRNLVRCEKARKKPYFGRIDFRDQKLPQEESYYVGRVGISDKDSEPVVIDWRAPVASIYYENSTGLCQYEVKNHGTYDVDLKRKRTYEIENDQLKDFFDSDVVANDELLTKYLAKEQKGGAGRDHRHDPAGTECDHPDLAEDEHHRSGSGRFRKNHGGHAPDLLHSLQL